MDDIEKSLTRAGLTPKGIKWAKENCHIVKPTGLNDYCEILKNDSIEIVYYYKKPLEDALGQFADEARKTDNIYDYYAKWEAEFDNMIDKTQDYGAFLKNAIDYVKKHGILKAEWKE